MQLAMATCISSVQQITMHFTLMFVKNANTINYEEWCDVAMWSCAYQGIYKNSWLGLQISISSNTCSQMHVQIKHFLAHLQDLIPTLACVIAYIIYSQLPTKIEIKSCRSARECCILSYMHLATGWCTTATQLFSTGSSWLFVSLLLIKIPTLSCFHIYSLLCILLCIAVRSCDEDATFILVDMSDSMHEQTNATSISQADDNKTFNEQLQQ